MWSQLYGNLLLPDQLDGIRERRRRSSQNAQRIRSSQESKGLFFVIALFVTSMIFKFCSHKQDVPKKKSSFCAVCWVPQNKMFQAAVTSFYVAGAEPNSCIPPFI